MTQNKNITREALQGVIEAYDCKLPLQHLVETLHFIAPDLSSAMTQSQKGITPVIDNQSSPLRSRFSWSASSVVRANIRYLFDDTYPIISSGARYDYSGTRCGLFQVIEMGEPTLPMLELSSGVRNARDPKEVLSDSDR